MSFRMSGEFCSGEAVRGRSSRRRGQTLVASLIVIAIIMILTVVYMRGTGGGKPAKPDGRGTTTMGAAKASAEDIACQSNVNQVRQLLMVAKTSDDSFKPATVDEIPGATSVSKCPVGKETYTIDPEPGEIHCPHLGHEKF